MARRRGSLGERLPLRFRPTGPEQLARGSIPRPEHGVPSSHGAQIRDATDLLAAKLTRASRDRVAGLADLRGCPRSARQRTKHRQRRGRQRPDVRRGPVTARCRYGRNSFAPGWPPARSPWSMRNDDAAEVSQLPPEHRRASARRGLAQLVVPRRYSESPPGESSGSGCGPRPVRIRMHQPLTDASPGRYGASVRDLFAASARQRSPFARRPPRHGDLAPGTRSYPASLCVVTLDAAPTHCGIGDQVCRLRVRGTPVRFEDPPAGAALRSGGSQPPAETVVRPVQAIRHISVPDFA